MTPIATDLPPNGAPRKTGTDTETTTMQAVYDAAISRFLSRNPMSYALFQEATDSLPGGNTRTQLHTAPFPVFMKSGKDHQVFSEDGHKYTDLVGELTAGIYGHSHPAIIEAIKDVLENVGLNLGATITAEQRHAKEICGRYHLDKVRFTNSGTEANLNALAGARAYIGKRKIVVFGGGYHGGVLSFSGGRPAANCVDMDDWIVAKYNDCESATPKAFPAQPNPPTSNISTHA